MSISRTVKLSHRVIDALPPPDPDWPSNNVEYSDTVETGLKLVVYRSGKRYFRYRCVVNGKKKMITIGEYPAVSVEKARSKVRGFKAQLADGIDPTATPDVDDSVLTFGNFVTKHYRPFAKMERRSFTDIDNRLTNRILPAFGDRPLTAIKRHEISEFHVKLGSEVAAPTANRTVATISAILNLAVERGLLESNPGRGIRKLKENGPRSRVLGGEELMRFMTKLLETLQTVTGQAIYMLITTGLRRGEVLNLKWENVHLTDKTIYLTMTKCGEPRFVPLNSQAFDLLTRLQRERGANGGYVFPGKGLTGHLTEVRKTFNAICKAAKISDLHCHDLRRAYASLLVNAEVPLSEIQGLLGHKNIATTQIYAKINQNSLRRATETAVTELQKVVNG